jgi:hypothetical protein
MKIKHFILGIVFYVAAIPIIESITEIIVTWLEYFKGKASKPVLKLNKELVDLQIELEKHDEGICIGFQAPSSDEDYEDDELEDKLKRYKKKR